VGKKRKPASAERIELLKMLGRRKYLLKKERAGSLTAQERTELKAMPPPKRGRPAEPQIGSEVDTSETAPQDDAVATEAAASEPGHGEDDAAAQPPPKVAPEVEAPPVVRIAPTAAGNWRAKYQQKVGREGLCRGAADLHCSLMLKLAAWIAEDGTRPFVGKEEIEALHPAAVLFYDQILPARLEMSAEVELVVGTGLALGQAGIVKLRRDRQKKIKSPPVTPLRTIPFEQPIARPAERPAPEDLRPADAAPPPPAPPPPSDDYRV
jgi:hypothetical protein